MTKWIMNALAVLKMTFKNIVEKYSNTQRSFMVRQYVPA